MRSIELQNTGLEVEQVATVAGLVASKLGVRVVPELTVPYFDPKQVALVELAAPALNRPVYVVTQVNVFKGSRRCPE